MTFLFRLLLELALFAETLHLKHVKSLKIHLIDGAFLSWPHPTQQHTKKSCPAVSWTYSCRNFLLRTSYTILRRRSALLSRFSPYPCRPPRKSNQHNNSSFRRRRQPVHHNSIRFGSVSCYACMLIISWRSSLFRGCGTVIVIRWFALISFHYADIWPICTAIF